MLSPADADLVRRDTALPGLGALLEPARLTAMIRRVLPHFDARLDITYVRYKPGQSCLIGYRLTDANGTSFVTATAMRRDAVGKQTKPLQQPIKDSLYGPGRLSFDENAILVSFFPNDDKLSSIERLTESFSWRHLLTKLLPDRTDLWNCCWEPIRYKPERRFVGRLTLNGTIRGSIKIYTEAGYESARVGASAFEDGETYQLPHVLGQSDRRHVLVFSWLPGRLLAVCMREPKFEPASVAYVGAALAELHSQPANALSHRQRSTGLTSLEQAAQWLAGVLPAIAKTTIALADRLIQRLQDEPPISKPIHGDFYANQVVLNRDNISFIDFDEAHRGDPACDLGAFIAHLESNAIRGHASPLLVEPMTHALLDGYRWRLEMSDERVALFTATALLRLALHPFRSREAAWPETTQAILNRAEDILNHFPRQFKVGTRDFAGATE